MCESRSNCWINRCLDRDVLHALLCQIVEARSAWITEGLLVWQKLECRANTSLGFPFGGSRLFYEDAVSSGPLCACLITAGPFSERSLCRFAPLLFLRLFALLNVALYMGSLELNQPTSPIQYFLQWLGFLFFGPINYKIGSDGFCFKKSLAQYNFLWKKAQ